MPLPGNLERPRAANDRDRQEGRSQKELEPSLAGLIFAWAHFS